MKFTTLVSSLVLAMSLSACGPETVSPDRLEEARSTAKTNSEFNAQMYRAANPRFTADFQIISRSDTSQNAGCPQGDGWVNVSIMKVDGKSVDKTVLMCSTYSSSVGCYRQEDFDKDQNLSGQDGRCRADVPYPLPVLKK